MICILKTILSKDGLSAYSITYSVFDDSIVIKDIYFIIWH